MFNKLIKVSVYILFVFSQWLSQNRNVWNVSISSSSDPHIASLHWLNSSPDAWRWVMFTLSRWNGFGPDSSGSSDSSELGDTQPWAARPARPAEWLRHTASSSAPAVISGVPALVQQQQLLPRRCRPPACRLPEPSQAAVRGRGRGRRDSVFGGLSSACLGLSRYVLGGRPGFLQAKWITQVLMQAAFSGAGSAQRVGLSLASSHRHQQE